MTLNLPSVIIMADDLKSSQNKKEGVIMTDSKELRRLIEEKGFKLKYVAERLGLSSYGLSLKIDNKQEFNIAMFILCLNPNLSHIITLCIDQILMIRYS